MAAKKHHSKMAGSSAELSTSSDISDDVVGNPSKKGWLLLFVVGAVLLLVPMIVLILCLCCSSSSDDGNAASALPPIDLADAIERAEREWAGLGKALPPVLQTAVGETPGDKVVFGDLVRERSPINAFAASFIDANVRSDTKSYTNGKKNLVFSPWNLSTALAVAAMEGQAAEGETPTTAGEATTAAEVQNAFLKLFVSANLHGIFDPTKNGNHKNAGHQLLRTVRTQINLITLRDRQAGGEKISALSVANRFFTDEKLSAQYMKLAREKYEAVVGPHVPKEEVNKWIADNTHGMILDFMKEDFQKDSTSLFAVLYFKAMWQR